MVLVDWCDVLNNAERNESFCVFYSKLFINSIVWLHRKIFVCVDLNSLPINSKCVAYNHSLVYTLTKYMMRYILVFNTHM